MRCYGFWIPSGVPVGLARVSSACSSPNLSILTAFPWLFPGTFEHSPVGCRWKAAFPSLSGFDIQILNRDCWNHDYVRGCQWKDISLLNFLLNRSVTGHISICLCCWRLLCFPVGFCKDIAEGLIVVSSAAKVDLMVFPPLCRARNKREIEYWACRNTELN